MSGWTRERPDGAVTEDWDAALHLSDRVSNHLVARREMALFQWLAVRLSDGGGDDVLYPSREDAVHGQLAPQYMTFVQVTPDAMSPRSAWRFLLAARVIHRRHRNRFHESAYMPIIPQRIEQLRELFR